MERTVGYPRHHSSSLILSIANFQRLSYEFWHTAPSNSKNAEQAAETGWARERSLALFWAHDCVSVGSRAFARLLFNRLL